MKEHTIAGIEDLRVAEVGGRSRGHDAEKAALCDCKTGSYNRKGKERDRGWMRVLRLGKIGALG